MAKGEETRQFILEQAAPVFNIKGIEATAMSDIMEATKLSKGSLYVHFKDKDDLAASVVEYNLHKLGNRIHAAMDKAGSAKERLFAFVDVTTDVLNPPVTGGCPLLNIGPEVDDTNPGINNKIQQGLEYSLKTISDIIKQGIAKGEFRANWNAKEFSTVMFAMIEGAILMARVEHNNRKTKIVARKIKQMITEQTI